MIDRALRKHVAALGTLTAPRSRGLYMISLKRLAFLLVAMMLVSAACGDDDSTTTEPTTATTAPATSTSAVAETTATAAPATTAAATTTVAAAEAIVIGVPDAEGVIAVAIDGEQLSPLFDAFQGGADPFYQVHTQQDDIFIGLELYTVFGDAWTGELGTFPTDCTTHGICVYLDPDGIGPLPGGGPGTGTITIEQLEGGTIATIDEVTIEADDGQVYMLSGVTLTG